MYTQSRAVILRRIPYSDNMSVVVAYSEAYGRISFFKRNNGSKQKRGQNALLFPLSLVRIVFDYRQNRDIHSLREIETDCNLESVGSQPVKNTIAFFLAEVLYRTLKEEVANPDMFSFLYNSILLLDRQEQAANFHLIFLLRLARFLGFMPHQRQDSDARFFDMVEGKWVHTAPATLHFLEGEMAKRWEMLLEVNFTDDHRSLGLSGKSRNEILQRILEYYAIHLEGLGEMKSLGVLQDFFKT